MRLWDKIGIIGLLLMLIGFIIGLDYLIIIGFQCIIMWVLTYTTY